ncbi:putative lipid phosphate phosphatase 3, chloroplastic, partial [Cucurbita argyrosperma subsp. argyrosperma]
MREPPHRNSQTVATAVTSPRSRRMDWLMWYAVVVPIAIFLLVYMRRRDPYHLHNAILGILISVLVYDRMGNVVCHGKKSYVLDGYKSFPSGHASWSFAGLGFLSLYLSGKLKVFDHGGHVAKLLVVLFPLLVAYVVGIFMVNDYMHHPQDVFFGSLMGLLVATLVYFQFFPSLFHHHQDVFIPTTEQSRTNDQTSDIPVNVVDRSIDIEAPAPLESRER